MHPTEFGNLEFERLDAARALPEPEDIIARTWDLARTRNRFVWPLLASSFAIYFGLLVLILAAPGAMGQSLYGDINLGLLVVCAQVLVTIITFWSYCVWAAARFDAQAESLRSSARERDAEARHV